MQLRKYLEEPILIILRAGNIHTEPQFLQGNWKRVSSLAFGERGNNTAFLYVQQLAKWLKLFKGWLTKELCEAGADACVCLTCFAGRHVYH